MSKSRKPLKDFTVDIYRVGSKVFRARTKTEAVDQARQWTALHYGAPKAIIGAHETVEAPESIMTEYQLERAADMKRWRELNSELESAKRSGNVSKIADLKVRLRAVEGMINEKYRVGSKESILSAVRQEALSSSFAPVRRRSRNPVGLGLFPLAAIAGIAYLVFKK